MRWRRCRSWSVCLLALCGLAGCGAAGGPDWQQLDEAALARLYSAAVADAAVAEPGEITRSLTALTTANKALRWRGESGQRQVLMVTWTSWTGYDSQVGRDLALSREAWVTAVPEIQEFCRRQALSSGIFVLRLEQLLGLPAHNGKTRFVEFWANPADVFRPSPDPEITDAEAELDFPQSANFVTVSPDHVAWFNALKATSYGANGYPWTRLGYTYDWGNPYSKVGLSEFVIRKGATVGVNAVSDNATYCAVLN